MFLYHNSRNGCSTALHGVLNLRREWPLLCLGQNALAGAANSHFPPSLSNFASANVATTVSASGWEQPTAPAASEAGATVRCGLIASAVLDKTWAFLSRPETTVFVENLSIACAGSRFMGKNSLRKVHPLFK